MKQKRNEAVLKNILIMKMFKSKATTSKGMFDVTIKVEEKTSPITGVCFYDISATVIIDNTLFECSVDRYKIDRIYAGEKLCSFFGVGINTALKCDISEALNYIKLLRKSKANLLNSIEESDQIFNKIHDL